MNILIITQGEDPHVTSVSDIIRKKGGNPVLFERYRRDHFICYNYSNQEFSFTLNVEGKIFDIQKDFQSVWWRVKPVIASEGVGIKSYITDNHSGFVLPVNDTKSFAELLIRLSKDKTLTNALGEKLKASLTEKYSWSGVLPRYEKLFFGVGPAKSLLERAA